MPGKADFTSAEYAMARHAYGETVPMTQAVERQACHPTGTYPRLQTAAGHFPRQTKCVPRMDTAVANRRGVADVSARQRPGLPPLPRVSHCGGSRFANPGLRNLTPSAQIRTNIPGCEQQYRDSPALHINSASVGIKSRPYNHVHP